MSIDLDAKQNAIAEIIDGHVVDDGERVGICVKGIVMGFPATFEAVGAGWPWPVAYTIETNPDKDDRSMYDSAKISVTPRVGRGLFRFFSQVLLFESRGQTVGDKKLESKLILGYDNRDVAERFLRYPGVDDRLLALEHLSKFSEMVIKTNTGIYLSQPTSFTALDLDVVRVTFREMAELGQVLFDSFSS